MPRGCGCAGNSCGCQIVPGAGIDVTGTGNASSPYIISLNNESGFASYNAVDFPGNNVVLTGAVADNITIRVESDVNFTVTLPADVSSGTQVDIFTTQSLGAVMTLDSTFPVLWPGGVDPVFTAVHAWVRLTFIDTFVGWVGVAHLNMAA